MNPQELGFQQGQLFADRLLEIGDAVFGRIGPQRIARGDRPQILGVRPRTSFDQEERKRPGLAVSVEHRRLKQVVVGQKGFERFRFAAGLAEVSEIR